MPVKPLNALKSRYWLGGLCLAARCDILDAGNNQVGRKMPRTASLKVVERQIKELKAKAEALKQTDKPGLKQLKAVMIKYRLTRSDVDAALKGRRRRGSKLAGRKLKPKYRNPNNKSEAWSGRGLQPKWLIAAMKSTGKKLEHFAV
jgi:DNA-binding protein H-NS